MRRSVLPVLLLAAACGGSPLFASFGPPVDLKVLNAHRDDYVDKTISVRGRIHVEPYQSAEPCSAATPNCNLPFATSLHVVVPNETRSDQNSVDLYRETSAGAFEPVTCRVLSATTFDCGRFKADDVTTVAGTFVKSRVPYQSVGTSGGGPTVVLQYRDAYVLVIK